MKKAAYGIDAPFVIVAFGVSGLLLIMMLVIAYHYSSNFNPVVFYVLASIVSIASLYCGLVAIMMLLSSLYGKKRVINELLDSLQLRDGEQILDIGCGRGMLLIEAAKRLRNGKVVGIDIWRQEDQSNNSARIAWQNIKAESVLPVVDIMTCDMTKMSFSDGSFDVVISSLAIHNVSSVQERKSAINEIARVLKPGGRVALLDFQHTQAYAQIFRDMNWNEVVVSGMNFKMFPPVRIVEAMKPA